MTTEDANCGEVRRGTQSRNAAANHRDRRPTFQAGTASTVQVSLALMTDAGLTNGAFYAHFESKDDLVANVVADQLATQCHRPRLATRGPEGTGGIHPRLPSPHVIGMIRARVARRPRCWMRSAAAMTPSAIPTPRECNPSST